MGSKKIPISKYSRIKVGITLGDPAGIGPVITAKALGRIGSLAQFVIIGDRWVSGRIPGYARLGPETKFVDLNNVRHKNFKFGRVRAEYGKASIAYLDKALEMINKKEIDCLVTCPISKEAIALAGYNYSGHTEYLACKTKARHVEMMLLNGDVRFVPVTRHIAVKRIAGELNKARIGRAVILTYRYLKTFFSIKEPRIAVCGLNPHASDNGVIGEEENRVIAPAIRSLRSKIKYLDGPLPADVAAARAKNKEYDCIISMYHDQALIPLKMLGEHAGVNITLGLPFVRTSPLHGTAFDIAGTDKADPASLIESIKLAVRCASNLKRA